MRIEERSGMTLRSLLTRPLTMAHKISRSVTTKPSAAPAAELHLPKKPISDSNSGPGGDHSISPASEERLKMESTCYAQRKELVEFHSIKLWQKDSRRKLEELYGGCGGLMSSYNEIEKLVLKQLEEALKPRPTVRPCVPRRRRVQLSNNYVGRTSPGVPDDSGPATRRSSSVDPDHLGPINTDTSFVSPDVSNATTSYIVPAAANLQSSLANLIPDTLTIREPPESHCSEKPGPVVKSTTSAVVPKVRLSTHPRNSGQTARKSTTFRVVKKSTLKKLQKKCRNIKCTVPLINLKTSNISESLKSQLRKYIRDISRREEKMKSSSKMMERKDSTDSGVASEEDEAKVVPAIKNEQEIRVEERVENTSISITTMRNEQEIRFGKRVDKLSTTIKHRPSTSKRKINATQGPKPKKQFPNEDISLQSSSYSKTGGVITPRKQGTTKHRPNVTKQMIPSPSKKLSIKVSIPWDDNLKIIHNNNRQSKRYLSSSKHGDNNNNSWTVLPKDVIPAVEFDLNKIQMAPLACKRYKEPAPLRFFSQYSGHPHVCVSCNKSFCREDYAKHMLAKH